MKRTYMLLGVLLVVSLTVLSGVIQGRMSHRWGQPVDFQEVARKLAAVPDRFGPWELDQTGELEAPVVRVLDCAGYLLRDYVRRDTGARVQVAVILGPPGPISVHTPDVCYSSRAYRTIQKEHWSLPDGDLEDVFWATTLEPVRINDGLLSVYHGWTTGRNWSAPKDARFEFAANRYLYKMHVAGQLREVSDAGGEQDPGRDFLEHFVPAIRPYLVPQDID